MTAVEWLISKLKLFNITKEEHYEILCQIELEAKEMEKQQCYSEEEVIQLVSDWTDYRMSEDAKSKVTFKKWFEQFKKK